MNKVTQLPFITLLLLISFASVNAVLFTPALPEITHFFSISEDGAQLTITLFLTGYALGQLIYGPLANRFGRKPALYVGILLQIASSLLCVLAGSIDAWWLFVNARIMLALGSGVGLKMTFTMVNECYEPRIASQKIAMLMLAFAITPGLSVALGGVLIRWYPWQSCFYAGALYGLLLLFLTMKLPETLQKKDTDALRLCHLLHGYSAVFKNRKLIAGGLLMGGSTSIVYIFAALAPFIAMNFFAMSSAQYGLANIIPSAGLILGSLVSVQLSNRYPLQFIIKTGMAITSLGVLIMFTATQGHLPAILSLFLPMVVIYFGLSLIMPNASTIAMTSVENKAHGSAVMNFINMGTATLMLLGLSLFSTGPLLLPVIYLLLCFGMLVVSVLFEKQKGFSVKSFGK